MILLRAQSAPDGADRVVGFIFGRLDEDLDAPHPLLVHVDMMAGRSKARESRVLRERPATVAEPAIRVTLSAPRRLSLVRGHLRQRTTRANIDRSKSSAPVRRTRNTVASGPSRAALAQQRFEDVADSMVGFQGVAKR